MPLSSGARLAPYEILTAIGAGGTGDLYGVRPSQINIITNWLEEPEAKIPRHK